MPWLQIRCNALPYRQAQRARCSNRIRTDNIHAAENERKYGSLELRSLRHADAGDRAPVFHRSDQPTERIAAEVIDGAGPKLRFHRLRSHLQFVAEQHALSTELL